MKPFYDDGQVTIYHGDCREMDLRALVDHPPVLVTDPPYGIAYRTSSSRSVAAEAHDWPAVVGDDAPFDPAHLLALDMPSVLWGANNYASRLPSSQTWLVWSKRLAGIVNDSADCELAWSNIGGPARVFQHPWMGMLRASESGEAYHPTQKPVALMRWVLMLCPPGTVLDPYMGSGSTLVAAVCEGRRAVGIEIEERYCEIAVQRLRQMPLISLSPRAGGAEMPGGGRLDLWDLDGPS
jgi:site-specific DNA-methyltransferase (adenine-specific)